MSACPASDPAELLAVWDRAATAVPEAREEALLVAARGAAPASLGARNCALLELRARLLGRAQQLRSGCPRCATEAQFAIDCQTLSGALAPSPEVGRAQRLDADGFRLEFRVPDASDLAETRPTGDDTAYASALLERCVTRCEHTDGRACAPGDLPAAVAEALSRRMEELDPGASVGFELICPECGEAWTAPMDVGDVVWSELRAHAERLLLDVDALARAYGWSEAEILALSPVRRAAYLQLVRAG